MSVSSKAADEADKKHISGPAKKRYVGGAINRAKQEKAGTAKKPAAKKAPKPAAKKVAKAAAKPIKTVMELWKQDPRKHTDEELWREWHSHAMFPLANRLRENRAAKLLREMQRRGA